LAFFHTPRFTPPGDSSNRTQDSVSTTFRRLVSASEIAALKILVEANFTGVGFNFTGNEFDYKVVVGGPTLPYEKAITYLFPKGRDDIQRTPFETLP